MRFPVLLVAIFALSGCSDDPEPPPRVFLYTQVGPGTEKDVNDSAKCNLPTEEWLSLGTREVPVESGAKVGTTSASVTCVVKPEGAGFRIAVSAAQQQRGSFTASGFVTGSGTQQKITGSFTRGDTGTFRQEDCSIEYDDKDMGVGAGKIWGHLICPHATFRGGQERTCLAQAVNFRFERCDK